MLDAVFIAATLVVFATIALIAKGVERLGPSPTSATPRATTNREDRA